MNIAYINMKDLPLISVIVPLYNKEKSIERTIKSVLRQDYKNFELVIINDGSTDKSVDIISKIIDERICIFSKQNGGVSDARNYGIASSKGKFILFLDADDTITSNCLSTFYQLTKKYKNVQIFTSNFNYHTLNGKNQLTHCRGSKERLIKNPLKAFWRKDIFPRTGNTLIYKECIEKIGGFKTEISFFEDLEFDIRLLRKYSIVYTPLILMNYNCDNIGLSADTHPISKEFVYYIDFKYTSYYEKLILAYHVYFSLLIHKNRKNKKSFSFIQNKFKSYTALIVYSRFASKLNNYRHKISKYVMQ